MSQRVILRSKVRFRRAKFVPEGPTAAGTAPSPGRVPRVSRLLALAIRFEGLLRACVVADCAELSRRGHVTRARISQIMNLLYLAPDIQEQILFLPRATNGREEITERTLRPLVAEPDWRRQQRMWARLKPAAGKGNPPDALHTPSE